MNKFVSVFCALMMATQCLALYGFGQANTASTPTHAEIIERYREADLLDSLNKRSVFKMNVQANWLKDGSAFWYKNILADSIMEYFYVDAASGRKTPLFDASRLADSLSYASGEKRAANKMNITAINFLGRDSMQLNMNGQEWLFNRNTYHGTLINNDTSADARRQAFTTGFRAYNRWQQHIIRGDSISPDKQWVAFIRAYNVFMRSLKNGIELQLTTDGTKAQPYGALLWSPDSKYFVGYKLDPREDKEVYYLLTSTPGTTRAQVKSQHYAQPGDPFTSYEMFVFGVISKAPLKVKTDNYNFLGMPYPRFNKDNNRYFTYEKADRGHQRFRIIEVDAITGNTRNLVDEKTSTFIYEQRVFTNYLSRTNEIIWTSEKDGWRHIYLVDIAKATMKPITSGAWVVRDIDSVDEKNKEIWFKASGMVDGEDPYNVHYYRIRFDGKGLLNLTPANGNHQLFFSPDKKYFIDTYSQPDVAPVTELHRTSDGKLIIQLENGDISAYLATGVKLPEVFHAKGRDGITEIWGVVCRPHNLNPLKQYPVIENIYAGPQDSFVPKSFMSYGEMQSIAELGFIVVQIDGMGTANRSKAFHDVCWKNLADAGLPDRILWIKALASKYGYIDTSRVGVYGTSAGGQNSLGALLFHPEFYKAAVSACGCHDNRVDKQWWNEQWMGYPVEKHYDEQSNITNASKLQGKLLLIVGEADTNVPPESTYRVVDALIKSGKSFDFLTVPGMGHSDGGPYGRKKKRDFFVKSLLGVDPPDRNRDELTRPERAAYLSPGR